MKTFYKAVRILSEGAFWYAPEILPHQDKLLFSAPYIKREMRQNGDISDSLRYLVKR